MPVVLLRVDERLIHGQVVLGWGERINIDRIVVVDDALSASAWEQELYCLGVPPSVDTLFVDVDTGRRDFARWRAEPRRVVVLVRDLETLHRLAAGGRLRGEAANLGGIHHAPGREPVLPYLFLSPAQRETLREIAGEGVSLSAQDLPATRPVPLEQLLGTA